jgi:hypothetical protein
MQYKLQLLKNLLLSASKDPLKLNPPLKDLLILNIAHINATRID